MIKRGVLRADAADPEHAALFRALLTRARCAAMTGAAETAANLFRFLLALDPTGDPCGVLLRLDADLYEANDDAALLELHDRPLPVAAWAGSVEPLFDDAPRSCAAPCRAGGAGLPEGTTALLPGLALNRALALRRSDLDDPSARKRAVAAVADALAAHPQLLTSMLRACGVDPDSDRTTTFDFREISWHEHFRKHVREAHLANAYAAGALPLAIDACCLRGRKFWSQPDALRLLHDGAKVLTKRLGPGKASTKTLAIVDNMWSATALAKWRPSGKLVRWFWRCPSPSKGRSALRAAAAPRPGDDPRSGRGARDDACGPTPQKSSKTASSSSRRRRYAAVPVEEFGDRFAQLGPDAAEGFDDSLLTADAARRAADERRMLQNGGVRRVAGGGGGFADARAMVDHVLAQLPEEVRADFEAQLAAGVPAEAVQQALLALLG